MNSSSNSPSMGTISWGGRPLIKGFQLLPRIIWAYWHDDNVPNSVALALESWAKYAPGYEVRLLSRETAESYTGRIPWQVRRKRHAAISDWIRFELLSKHGGIWMDASLILLGPIEETLPEPSILSGQPFMYFNRDWSSDPTSPMLESWMISAPKDSEYMRKLSKEYRLACIKRKWYIKLMNLRFGRKILQGYPEIAYYCCFAAMQSVLFANPHLTVATIDSEAGPYAVHRRLGYDSNLIADAVQSGNFGDASAIKLRSGDREVLEGRR